jgi:hypothetical protein
MTSIPLRSLCSFVCCLGSAFVTILTWSSFACNYRRLSSQGAGNGHDHADGVSAWSWAPEYFRDCFVKLSSFQLTGYHRVVVVDADAVPLKSLDFLLTLPFDGPLAAPRAYWLPQPCWTSALLVVRPSRTLWTRLKRSLKIAPKPNSSEIFADMELVNREFGSGIHTLPLRMGRRRPTHIFR